MCYLESASMMGGHMGQQQHLQQQQNTNNIGSNYMQQGNGIQNVGPPPPPAPQQADPVQSPSSASLHCIRQGCPNPAVVNSEWEDEYCSNECVVSHCRDVFNTWVASSRQPVQQNFSTVT